MKVYKKRRDALLKELGPCAATIKSQTTDDNLDEYFFYLTGIEEAGATLTFAPRATVTKTELSLPTRKPLSHNWNAY